MLERRAREHARSRTQNFSLHGETASPRVLIPGSSREDDPDENQIRNEAPPRPPRPSAPFQELSRDQRGTLESSSSTRSLRAADYPLSQFGNVESSPQPTSATRATNSHHAVPVWPALPSVEEQNWFDQFVKKLHALKYLRRNSSWSRAVALIFGIFLTLSVFVLAGVVFFHHYSAHDPGSTSDELVLFPKSCLSWMERQSIHVAGQPLVPHVAKLNESLLLDVVGTVTKPSTEASTRFQFVSLVQSECEDFTHFYLCADRSDGTCVVFLAVKPTVRTVKVVKMENVPDLVGDPEKQLFFKWCDPSKVYRNLLF